MEAPDGLIGEMQQLSINEDRDRRENAREDDDRNRGEIEEQKQVTLDHTLWCNLPEHIIDAVLAWLPVSCLVRYRAVCKRWNSIITSKHFHSLCSRVRERKPYFLMFADHFHRRVAAVYDQEISAWHFLEFSCFMRCRFPESFLVLASAGGLLCLEGTGSQSGNLFVSNPIARCWRKLPPMVPMRSPYVVGMVSTKQQQQEYYQILVAQDGEHLASQVYDSRTNTWNVGGVLHRRTAILAGATFYNGLLYCLAFSPNGLLAFDLNTKEWRTLDDIVLPPGITCPHLMNHRGDLLLIAGVEELGALQSVKIWELRPAHQQHQHQQTTSTEWIERIKLPDDAFKRLFTSFSGQFICIPHTDFVALHEYYSPQILVLHLVDRSCHWLSCSLSQNLEARSILGYAFEPRIEAVP